jgi:hypothetical protein
MLERYMKIRVISLFLFFIPSLGIADPYSFHPEEEILLKEIKLNWDELGPRLRYSEWLTNRGMGRTDGNTIRGMFIALDVAILKLAQKGEVGTLRFNALVESRQKIRWDAWQAWKELISPVGGASVLMGDFPEFDRGIPVNFGMTLSKTSDVARFAKIFPIQQWVIYDIEGGDDLEVRKVLGDFLKLPELDEVQSLTFAFPNERRNRRRHFLYDDSSEKIVETIMSADFSRRKKIALEGLAINGDLLLATLLKGGAACKICHMTHLNFSNNFITDTGAKLLAEAIRAGHLPLLESVILRTNEITYAGVLELSTAATEAKLELVDLTDNVLVPESTKEACKARIAQFRLLLRRTPRAVRF